MNRHRAPAPRVDFRVYVLFAALFLGGLVVSPLIFGGAA